MVPLRLNPYVHFIEDHLAPHSVRYGMVHRLSGEVWLLTEQLRPLLLGLSTANILLTEDELNRLEALGFQVKILQEQRFLIPLDADPIEPFMDHYVVRPSQNPALAYRSESGLTILVRTSMEYFVCSPKQGELPLIVEETLPPDVAELFILADGSRTLNEILTVMNLQGVVLNDALNFLTSPERQLIKFAPELKNLGDQNQAFNSVPRSLSHSLRWDPDKDSLSNFHQHGIEDTSWEFDWIESTVNHAFRFPSEVLGGLNYGSRFCLSTLKLEVIAALSRSRRLEVLEIGGGTGSFARSFIEQASGLADVNYHILDLSPVLAENQRRLLASLPNQITHFQQDATELSLPGYKFDLVIANEVIADFPTASVRRVQDNVEGDGAADIHRYQLSIADAPETFLINSGVFRFLERAWEHLAPGGTLILSEYGAVDRYPIRQHYLNHEETSIHFGHVAACAERVGFSYRLITLKDFMGLDDRIPILDGAAEQIYCLNHVLNKFGLSLPYAAISKGEFDNRFGELAKSIGLTGVTFSPLRSGFHFGPPVNDFMVLILNRPAH